MHASNSVSTIFRCMSCSFGTRDQAAYAAHIKCCSNESSTETLPAKSEGEMVRNNSSRKAKRRHKSYICSECFLPAGSTKALLLHRQDVHGEDFQIFACKFCSDYAARSYSLVYKHATRMHPQSTGRVCTKLQKKSAIPYLPASNKASANERDISKEEAEPSNQNEPSSSGSELCQPQVKSSRSLGLNFLGKRLAGIGVRYFCQLCNFSHGLSQVVAKHIWKDHYDKLGEVVAEASTKQATDDTKVTITLYKCEDCSYSTHAKLSLYKHCAHHQFEGPSKCPYCSFCAMNDGAIVVHAHKCHADQSSDDLKLQLSAQPPKNISGKISASHKVALRSRNSSYKKLAQQQRKKKWFTCPYCPFKSRWSGSLSHHKSRVHTELNKACRKRPSADSVSLSKKLKEINTDDTVEVNSSCFRTGQQMPSGDRLLPDTTALKKYTCVVCSRVCKSQKTLYIHKRAHLDCRPYQCPHCGLRSNYQPNVWKHIKVVHNDNKGRVTKLSLENAKRTIAAYRMGHVTESHRPIKHMYSSATAKRSILQHPVSCGSSSEDSLLQVKQPTADNAANSCVGTDFLSRQKSYMCSLCKMKTAHLSSVYRHIANVHRGCKAKAILVKGKMFLQRTKLAVPRETAENPKLNAETTDDNREHDSSSGVEFAMENTVKLSEIHDISGNDDNVVCPARDTRSSGNTIVQPPPEEHRILKKDYGFVCDICPYKARALSSVNAHRKLHVKRSGYDLECSVCPYFVRQTSHLERHMQLHAKSVDKKPKRNTDLKGIFYLCGLCPYMAVNRGALIYHKQLHRRRAMALYKCEHCAFWVTEPHYLFSHARVHTAEYMQRRTEYRERLQTSGSLGSDATEVASEKYPAVTSHLSASGNTDQPSGLPVENVMMPAKVQMEEVIQNKSADDWNESTGMIKGESAAATDEEKIHVSPHIRSSTANRQLATWCCERCPYSSSKMACFKRHTWLHGKQYQYECRYCDYSVRSYWQLVSHMLWHFAPNKHLVYAQSVSNMDSFPSQLPNRDSIPDSLTSVDRFIPSFENSDVFLLSDAANFQCQHCPFVTEQRSEFFTHMLCHDEHTAAYSCPYCNFHTDLREKLSAHVLLHFNLPGCRLSSLPPNLCHSDGWKQLEAAIEAVADKGTHSTEPDNVLTDNCSDWCGQAESASLLKADVLVTENEAGKQSESEHDLPVVKSHSSSAVVRTESDGTSTLTSAPQSAESAVHASESVLTDKHRASVAHSTMSVNNSVVEAHLSADGVTPDLIDQTKLCRYCDRFIDDADALVKHEAGHLIGLSPCLKW